MRVKAFIQGLLAKTPSSNKDSVQLLVSGTIL